MSTHDWLGFEDEEHEGNAHAEYHDFDEQATLSPEAEREQHEFVRRVAAEYGFPLSNWAPTIPTRQRV